MFLGVVRRCVVRYGSSDPRFGTDIEAGNSYLNIGGGCCCWPICRATSADYGITFAADTWGEGMEIG